MNRKEQARILRRYQHQLPITQTRIALLANTSIETVRRTLNGVQSHQGTLRVLREAFLSIWDELPADLDRMFTEILADVR